MTEAVLRCRRLDGTTWLAVLDVAALLLDAAGTTDTHPEVTASTALRGIADGLTSYQPPTSEENR
jgi:hypothetical protein